MRRRGGRGSGRRVGEGRQHRRQKLSGGQRRSYKQGPEMKLSEGDRNDASWEESRKGGGGR